MQDKYFISHDGEQRGPLSIEEILTLLESTEIVPTDYYYNEALSDWEMLMSHPQVAEKFGSHLPIPNGEVETNEDKNEEDHDNENVVDFETQKELKKEEWYVLQGENRCGPFTYYNIIQMLQEKQLYEYDYVWHASLDNWQRVAELDEFQPDTILEIYKTNPQAMKGSETSDVFFRRRHMRVEFGGSIIIHNQKTLWKGQGVEISSGGAGILMENSQLMPGDHLFLHFKPGAEVPAFNAVCEVVSKEYSANVKDGDSVRYGVQFKDLNKEVRRSIASFSKKAAA